MNASITRLALPASAALPSRTLAPRLKLMLLAVGLLGFAVGGAEADPSYTGPCDLSGSTVTCTGSEASGGVNIGDVGVTQLNVNNVTGDIAPADDSGGVVLDTSSAASANVQLGEHAVHAKGGDGVYISAWGDDTAASLTLGGDVESLGGKGVVVTGSGAVTANTTSNINSDGDALTAKSWGGAVEVNQTGSLTSAEGQGLYVEGLGSDIDVEGNIDSLGDGVYSHSWGGDGVDGVTTVLVNGTVNAREGSGVVVQEDNLDQTDPDNPVYGTAAVTVNGALTAHDDGISVTAEGDVTISHTGKLTTDTGTGIYGDSSFGAVEIHQYGDALTAHGDAIVGQAYAVGSGVTISSAYGVTSDAGRGVVATAAGGSVTLTLKGVTSKLDTIHAEAGNSGSVQINADGDVTSYDGNAIYAKSLHSTVNVTVTNGDVTSKLDAIYAEAGNASTATVNVGDVTSYDGKGITATSFQGTTNVTAADVTAKQDAITLTGPGGNTLNAGDVVSYDGAGVQALATNGGASLTIGDVTSKLRAIDAEGTSTVTVGAGDVVSYDDAGVFAKSVNSSVGVTVGDVTSKLDAIHAEGPAGVTVNAGDVVSYDGEGVFAKASSWMMNAGVTTGDVTSKEDAIHAEATNGRATVSAGDVTSYDGAGVFALSGQGSVSVTTDDVTSELDAIHAEGTTTATVNAGDVTSYNGDGVYAKGADGDVGVTTGDVNSEFDAIYAETVSNGKVTVSAGDVTSAEGIGIHAKSVLDLVNVTAGDVTSELYAVSAISGNGSSTVNVGKVFSYEGTGVYATAANGFVEVTATGDVTADQDAITAESAAGDDGHVTVNVTGDVDSGDGKGVIANAVNGAVDVEVSGKITGKLDAVDAHSNNGSVTVAAGGGIVSDDGKAVDASADNGAVSVTVGTESPLAVADVTSKLDAITVEAHSGAATVDVTGDVTSYDGKAVSATSDTDLVSVTVGGDVTSKLDSIYAQSNSGAATVGVTGDVTSYDGKAIYAESDTSPVSITIGGSVTSKLDAIYAQSHSGSPSDLVNVEVDGDLTSYDGQGIQAVADNGGVVVKVDGDVETKQDAITASTSGDGDASTVSVTTGGDITSYDGRGIVASAANRGVTISSTGAVTTELTGIYARSSGGDGNASIGITQTGHVISWKGAGIDALSTGGPVSVTTSGGIEADQDAIVAESQGGDDVGTVTVKNTSGNIVSHKGNGVTATAARDGVSVDVTGDIDADQNGISATSTGDTETSGVTVTETGKITVANGSGIYVSSLADAGITLDGEISGGAHGIDATSLAGAITATIDEGGKISGASGAGVYLNSYTGATLTNHGDLSSAYGPAFEIDGDGVGTVDNYGTISGDFAFDSAAGTFNNYEDATYNADTEMDFLGGGTFNNAGLLSMSTDQSDSALANVYLNGNFDQTSTGTLRTDIRFTDNWSDRLVVSGTAELAGNVSVNVNGDLFDGIDKDFTILTAAGGATLDNVTLSNPVLRGTITKQNDTDVILSINDIDFDPVGLDEAAAPLAQYLDNIFKVGVPDDLQPLLGALVSVPDLDTYKQAIAELEPEEYGQDLANAYGYNLDFTNRLLSCRVADGPNRFKAEGDCDWVGARLSNAEQDASGSMSAYNQTLASFEAGAQRRLEGPWRVGAGLAFSNAAATAADGSTIHDTQGQGGVVVKYDAGPWLLATVFSGGFGTHHTERNVTIGNIDQTLVGDAPVAYASTRLDAAYTFDLGAAYIKPLLNVDLTASYFGGVTETGGSAAMTIDPATDYAASFNPAIEIGGEFADRSGNLVRPYVQVGLLASVMSDPSLTARFVAVDPAIGDFTVPTPTNEPAVKVSVGADVLTKTNDTLRLFYEGAFSASSRKNSVGLKVSHNF